MLALHMSLLIPALSLHGAADIAQLALAGIALVALLAALGQLWVSRSNARRSRVYEYADRFNQPDTLDATARYKSYWKKHSFKEFSELPELIRLRLNMLPNLIEEVAWLYNRNLLDRNVAAELLGTYVEALWAVSVTAVMERRQIRNAPGVFSEWEAMQRDTRMRWPKAWRKGERRRAWRKLLRGR